MAALQLTGGASRRRQPPVEDQLERSHLSHVVLSTGYCLMQINRVEPNPPCRSMQPIVESPCVKIAETMRHCSAVAPLDRRSTTLASPAA